jgi:hypothetical protein
LGVGGGGCGRNIDRTGRRDIGNSDKQILLDFTLNWDPSDKLSTWVNLDYMAPANDNRSGKPYVVGIAAAGRYAITDATGISLRGEFIKSNDNYLEVAAPPFNLANVATDPLPGVLTGLPGWYREDQQLWSLTATLDHALTEHLSIKAEAVYQAGSANHDVSDNQYFCDKTCVDNDGMDQRQVLLGAQMTYEF